MKLKTANNDHNFDIFSKMKIVDLKISFGTKI